VEGSFDISEDHDNSLSGTRHPEDADDSIGESEEAGEVDVNLPSGLPGAMGRGRWVRMSRQPGSKTVQSAIKMHHSHT
jgi:hypothetical protein